MTQKKKMQMILVNAITISRIVGSIILFPIYFMYGPKVVGSILLFLFLTDWIDGYLARKYKVSTFFGALMDSWCDKSMAIASCIILCFINEYLIYSIIIEVLIVIVNTLVFTQKGNIKSSYIGKVKTWILSVAIIIGFFICGPNKHLINICVALPAIIAEFITLVDYVKKMLSIEFKFSTKSPEYKSLKEINKVLFNPEFYEKHKDSTGLINYIYKD